MTTTLITGGNKGIGKATARRLLAAGHEVWIGARDEARGRAAAEELGARFVQLDVLDDASVAAAVERVRETGLDVLVNNAAQPGPSPGDAGGVTSDSLEKVFSTNVFGVARVTGAFLPLLEQSVNPVIVNVSSSIGSFWINLNAERMEHPIFEPEYSASKAALNMLTVHYAKRLPEVQIHLVDPGHTSTDFNGHSGPQTPDEAAEQVARMAMDDGTAPALTYTNRHGELAW